jgi:hypothetical protein
MEAVRADARQHFAPAQLGVAIPGGAEAAVHTARAWYDRHQGQPGKVLVKLDFKNAFNLVSRQAVLDAVTARFPALTRWVTWCYKQPSDLHFGTTTLLSAGGVQQGDPLGPLLFAGALHSLVLDLRQGPLDLVFFYLDDGVIAGDVAAVGAAVAHIQAQSAQLGLHLNLDKSEAISLGATTAALSAHLPPALVLDSSGQSRVQANFELLGAAVGDAAFIAAHTQKRTTSALDLLDAISTLDDPQVALRLLRSSGGHCRMVHNMRCTPPSAQLQGFKAFDQGVRACFSSFTGLHPTDGQWQQAARGFDQAGLGLRSAHLDGAAAYLASFGKSRELCRQLDPMLGDAELLASGHAAAALDLYNGHLPAAQKAILPTCLGQTQKQLTQALDAASWDAQVSTSSLTGRALLLSEATQGGRAFLTARPAGPLCLEPAIFLAELRHRLGMPDAADDAWCPQCNGILDRFSLLELVRPVENAPCGTMPCEMSSTGGLKGQACTQNGKSLGFFCLSGQKTLALGAGGQPMCLFPALQAFRPHSTSLSQLLSGLKAYVRLVAKPLRLQMLTPTSRQTTSRLHRFARIKGYGFNRWWSSPQVLGPLRLRILFDYLPEPQQPVKAKMRLLATPISCRSSVLPLAAFAAGRPFVVEPSLSAPRRRMSPDGMLPCFLPLRPARVEVECEVTCFVCNQSPSRP